MTFFFFFLNSTLKSQSTSSKPTGPKETSPMYSYTIHKYSIYIYLNPQQTGWTTRFSSRDCATFAFSSSNNTATLDCIATLPREKLFICALRKTAWNCMRRKFLRYLPRRNSCGMSVA